MRPVDTLHNPFSNRFNDPVSRREDEMQSEAYMVWLRERNVKGGLDQQAAKVKIDSTPSHIRRVLGGAFGLFVLIVSLAVLLKVV